MVFSAVKPNREAPPNDETRSTGPGENARPTAIAVRVGCGRPLPPGESKEIQLVPIAPAARASHFPPALQLGPTRSATRLMALR